MKSEVLPLSKEMQSLFRLVSAALITIAIASNLAIWLFGTLPFVVINWHEPPVRHVFWLGRCVLLLWIMGCVGLLWAGKKLKLDAKRQLLEVVLFLWITVGPYCVAVVYLVGAALERQPEEKRALAAFGVGLFGLASIIAIRILRRAFYNLLLRRTVTDSEGVKP